MAVICPTLIAETAPGLCRQIDNYCERRDLTLLGEPLNALTNLAMIVVAIAMARLQVAHPNRDAAGLIWACIVAVFIGGIGATLFHTTATLWALITDMAPFLVFMLLILWLTMSPSFCLAALGGGTLFGCVLRHRLRGGARDSAMGPSWRRLLSDPAHHPLHCCRGAARSPVGGGRQLSRGKRCVSKRDCSPRTGRTVVRCGSFRYPFPVASARRTTGLHPDPSGNPSHAAAAQSGRHSGDLNGTNSAQTVMPVDIAPTIRP